jgi:hypothetical protein
MEKHMIPGTAKQKKKNEFEMHFEHLPSMHKD